MKNKIKNEIKVETKYWHECRITVVDTTQNETKLLNRKI